MRTRNLALCALALLGGFARAQDNPFMLGGMGEMRPPWQEFKLNAKTKVKLNFKNSNIDMVLALYTKLSGITIVKDPNLTTPFTITSAAPVSLDEAFKILNTTLGLKNYEIKKDGNLLVIKPKPAQGRGGQGGFGSMSPDDMRRMMEGMGNRDGQPELRVYDIKHASAASVARTINDVFQGQQDPFSQLMQQMGGGGFGRFGGGGGFNRGQMGGASRFSFPQGLGGRNNTSSVRASSDDYSNTVIVNAPAKIHGQIRELLDKIDMNTEQPLKPRVFKLEFAAADEISAVIQNVLTSNAPRGRGAQGNQNIPIEQRFQAAFRLGNAQAAFGSVVSEPRTNSLVVTATEDNLTLVEAVIKELDKEVSFESSTFVVPLANARADSVAQLLNQAFGTRGGGQFGNRFGQGGGQNRNNQNRNPFQNRPGGGGGGGGGGFGGGLQSRIPGSTELANDPNSLAIDVMDPNADESELMTEIEVAQGFQFFGGGQNQQNRRPQSQILDRDSQGRLINVRDLAGQVTVIPDPNTNSLIIVTTPGNAALIQGILEQLDRIPEQVMIETIIVEATLDASTKLGVEWNLTNSRPFGTPGTTGNTGSNFGLNVPGAQGFKFTLTGGSLTSFLNALQTDQKFEVLSTPRIFTSNNTEAQINISQRVPYIVSQREDANGNILFNYAFEDVGIILTVTPRITANGQVSMEINQQASELQGFTSFNAPIINQRLADTTVSVKDGETIILGGIIRNTVTSTVKKVPLLGDIPLLGNLFKSTDKAKSKTELLVFLTPRIVKSPEEAQKLREESQKQISSGTKRILGDKVPPSKDGKQNPPPTSGGDKRNGGTK